MEIRVNRWNEYYIFKLFDEEDNVLSRLSAKIITSRLNGAEIRCLVVGGVLTEPEYRRGGLVRKLFDAMHKFAQEEKCLVTLLHPFSFEYYRKFGYERISNHTTLELPMSALSFVPRYNKLKRYDNTAMAKDLVSIYNEYAKNRNIMVERTTESYPIPEDGKTIYVLYEEGVPKAYVSLFAESRFEVNRNVSVNLHVYEMCFSSPSDLEKLMGFLRMYEGNLESIKIYDVSMSPEVELMLRNYEHLKIRQYPDVAARIHNTAGVLEAVKYPEEKGCFTIKVTEPEKSEHSSKNTEGIFKVEYENGKGVVTKLSSDAKFDFETDITALTPLIYGFNSYGYETARYSKSIKFNNPCCDFFRAFPNRPCGAYEHF